MELVEGEVLACVLTLWFAKYSSLTMSLSLKCPLLPGRVRARTSSVSQKTSWKLSRTHTHTNEYNLKFATSSKILYDHKCNANKINTGFFLKIILKLFLKNKLEIVRNEVLAIRVTWLPCRGRVYMWFCAKNRHETSRNRLENM